VDIVERLIGWRQKPAAAWGIAALLFAAAFVVRLAMPVNLPFVTFFPVIVLITLVAGAWAGFASTILSALLALSFFLSPAGYAGPMLMTEIVSVGAFILMAGLLVVLAEKLAAALEAQVRARELSASLAREMVHRQKNLLALATSIVRMSARSARSASELERQAVARLNAFAASLAPDGSTQSLRELAHRHVEAFAGSGTLVVTGPDVMLNALQSTYVGLAFHELATNSAKYGAWQTGKGSVSIETNLSTAGTTIGWVESIGRTVVASGDKAGFGRQLLERIVPQSLGGTARYAIHGDRLAWTLTLPGNAEAAGEVVTFDPERASAPIARSAGA
jgi:two-component sensor histidine kinase